MASVNLKAFGSNAAQVGSLTFLAVGLGAGFVLTLCRDAIDQICYAFLASTKTSHVPSNKAARTSDKLIEVCCDNITSVVEALQGGATSLELCADRPQGGVTPSLGFIEESVRLASSYQAAVHVLIRPRPGGFHYSNQEFEILVKDILTAKAAGAQGVVIGVLNAAGRIDVNRLRVLRILSQGLALTFHRAFDVCEDEIKDALSILIDAGCDRLLTSGRHKSAVDGRNVLREMQLSLVGSTNTITNASETTVDATVNDSKCLSSNTECAKNSIELTTNASGGVFASIRDFFLGAVSGDGEGEKPAEDPSVSVYEIAKEVMRTNRAKIPLTIVAAAGIAANDDLRSLLLHADVRAIHAGSSLCLPRQGGTPVSAQTPITGVVHLGQTGTADENSYSCIHHTKVQELVTIANSVWEENDKALIVEEMARVVCERTLEEVLKECMPSGVIDRLSAPPTAPVSPSSAEDEIYEESRSV